MKNFLVLLILAVSFYGCKTDGAQVVVPLLYPKAQLNKPITIERIKLEKLKEPFIIKSGDKEIPYQLDDLNNDGKWDVVFLLADFEASVKKNFSFIKVDKTPTFKRKVAITFAEINPPHNRCHDALRVKSTDPKKASELYQMEGPAWENDVVGFRNYYDQRNVIDIFGKQTAELALAKAGIDGQNYHELDSWGMDILHVGSSLGAGGIALQVEDSIYRIAEPEKSSFEIITTGPLRAIFNLKHTNLKIDSIQYDITHQISIYAGANFYESAIFVKGLRGTEKLVTGIVNLHSDTLLLEETDDSFIMATHAKQSENDAMLGMAISFDKNDFIGRKKLPAKDADLTTSYAAILRLNPNKTTRFKFYVAWETQDKKMADEKYFLESLTK